jgi:hypothetical protein
LKVPHPLVGAVEKGADRTLKYELFKQLGDRFSPNDDNNARSCCLCTLERQLETYG